MAKINEKEPVIKTGQVRKAYEDDKRSTVTKSMNVRNAVSPSSQTFLAIHLSMTGRIMTQELSPGGWTPHMKGLGMLVVSLRGVNFGFWSHLGCSGQNAIIFSREGLV